MKRVAFAIGAFAAVAAVLLFVGCRAEQQGTALADDYFMVDIGGSTSVVPVLNALMGDFHAANPRIRLNVLGTGSGDGIRNAGTLYQFGLSSRALTQDELGLGLNQQPVAIDGIAVVVHYASPVSNLSMAQIRGIYTGAITDWSQITGAKSGAIAVFTREAGSGTRSAFEEMVGFTGQLRAGAYEGRSTAAVRSNVSVHPNAIGYISVGAVTEMVRAVNVDGVAPTMANMMNGSYGISRPFILLYRDLQPESRAFLDWAITEGQVIVARGWIPIN